MNEFFMLNIVLPYRFDFKIFITVTLIASIIIILIFNFVIEYIKTFHYIFQIEDIQDPVKVNRYFIHYGRFSLIQILIF